MGIFTGPFPDPHGHSWLAGGIGCFPVIMPRRRCRRCGITGWDRGWGAPCIGALVVPCATPGGSGREVSP